MVAAVARRSRIRLSWSRRASATLHAFGWLLLACASSTASAQALEPDPEPAGELEPAGASQPELSLDPDAARLGGMSLDELLGLEIRAPSTLPQTAREAPSLVSVVTREQVERYGYVSLNDILYHQAGFSPSRDYDRRTVSSRGLFEGWNNNHLLLLIDGVPYNDNFYGSAYTWEITPLFLMQSVEIVRGPGSALYGSNATNGVLSINTLSARDYDRRGLARVRIGSQGHQIYDAITAVAGEHLGVVVGFNRFSTSGFEYASYDGSGRTSATNPGDLARFRIRDDRSSNYLFTKVEGYGALEGLQLSVHYQSWNFQTGHGWLFQVPDFPESMHESRILATLSYQRESERLTQSYAVRFQHHAIDWNMRYFPNGTQITDGMGGVLNDYDAGLWEYLRTNGDDVYAKAQLTFHLPREASVLVGLSSDTFWYDGDQAHFSNVDINSDGSFQPFPGNQSGALGPYLEWIDHLPIVSAGGYTQFDSGKLFSRYLRLTAGLRYDLVSVRYHAAIDGSTDDVDARLFQQLSPRVGLVSAVTDDLYLKLLAARAFRAPSPTELAGANTYALASNIEELDPEVVTTVEFAGDYRISDSLSWRANFFFNRFENQIAYSPSNYNLSTNIYTLSTLGVETELYFQSGPFSGYANYSFAHRLGEDILDPSVAESDGKLTWAPAHVANVGGVYHDHGFTGALQLHFQGRVERRTGEATPTRPSDVKPWLGVDLRVAYAPAEWIELGLMLNNALDGLFGGQPGNMLIKNFGFPFDYRADGRRIMGSVTLRL
jgi:iron complex outermembrane receptor protein